MPTELRLAPHALLGGAHMIEIVHDGELIGGVYALSDGVAGVHVTTKFKIACELKRDGKLSTLEVKIVR